MIKIYLKRNNEKKLAKSFKNDFENQLKAIFYILEIKKYFQEKNYQNIKIIVNNKHLQNIANS
jgi:hypothetical protein